MFPALSVSIIPSTPRYLRFCLNPAFSKATNPHPQSVSEYSSTHPALDNSSVEPSESVLNCHSNGNSPALEIVTVLTTDSWSYNISQIDSGLTNATGPHSSLKTTPSSRELFS